MVLIQQLYKLCRIEDKERDEQRGARDKPQLSFPAAAVTV